jgi:ribosomal protein L11 methyltransferase
MPERWLYVVVSSPSDWEAELLAEGLLAAGATGVEQQGAALSTWFRDPGDPDRFVSGLRAGLGAHTGAEVQLSWEWRPAADWAQEWRRGLGARRIGRHLVVVPSWIEPVIAEGDVVLSIDPKMAFGTGEHASTRGVLRLLEPVMEPGSTVLDVGTGSGILAIAAARLGATAVLAVESDGEALPNARENLERNGVADRVALQHALVDAAFLAARPAGYDVILANVLSGVLRPLLPGFRSALKPGGLVILSGILAEEAEMMLDAAAAAGLMVAAEDREDEWWSVRLQAPR